MKTSRFDWFLVLSVLAVFGLGARSADAGLSPEHRAQALDTCLDCHDLEGSLEARVPHAPAKSGDCSSCHNPHVSRHAGLLKNETGDLCTSCHSPVIAEMEKPYVHPPVAQGDCGACHEPHGSSFQGLMKGSREEICGSCHQEIATWSNYPIQHVPFAQGRCSVCHEPHGSDNEGLTKSTGSRICSSCHPANDALLSAHKNYPVQKAACHECHDPHGSPHEGLFRESLHSPFARGSCTICHPVASNRNPFAPIKSESILCGRCHEDQVRQSRQAAFPHVSAGGGECTSCHNPHTGVGDALLRRSETTTCSTCHNPGGARSGQPGRHLTHGDGVSCTDCHEAHGGERPLFLVQDRVGLCRECHDLEHGIHHPQGEDVLDPRNGQPVSCLSCHAAHNAPFDYYMRAEAGGELCIGCHKSVGGLTP